MKRIAFFVIFLGFSAAANAAVSDALIFKVNGQLQTGEITLQTSQSIELSFEIAAGHNVSNLYLEYKILNTRAEFLTQNVSFPTPTDSPFTLVKYNSQLLRFWRNYEIADPDLISGPKVLMQGLQLHCLGADPNPNEPTIFQIVVAGEVTVDGQQLAPVGTVISTLSIHQIPEPMTLMLLGLGSLFIMRRRK